MGEGGGSEVVSLLRPLGSSENADAKRTRSTADFSTEEQEEQWTTINQPLSTYNVIRLQRPFKGNTSKAFHAKENSVGVKT